MTTDLTMVLGRLLTDPVLRSDFAENPGTVIQKFRLPSSAATALQQLDPVELDRQAQCLIDKRFHEVAKLIPRTVQQLGAAARQVFQEYATGFWPDTHRRHLQDAAEFSRYLSGPRSGAVCRSERNLVRFRLSARRIAVSLVPDAWARDRSRPALQVLVRTDDGRAVEYLWYLRIPQLFRRQNRPQSESGRQVKPEPDGVL